MCYDPTSIRVYVSSHARFVQTEFSGLTQTTRPTASPHGTISQAPSPPVPPDVTEAEHTTDGADTGQPDGASIQEGNENDMPADDVGTIAHRLSRRRRMPAAVMASDLLAEPRSRKGRRPAEHLRDTGLQTIHVDYERGGIGHDLAREDVASRVAELAFDALCIAVVVSPPCSTWSAARFEPGDPQVLRTTELPMGVPQKDGGLYP
eukprot:6213223-Pleurochrysis_carterae.AAC.1